MNPVKTDHPENVGKTTGQSSDTALFLRKAYALVNSCPSELGGWSENGESFLVRDVEEFSNSVVPTFYKHNNWSSFVRQLNFYGFRKVKSDLNVNSPLVWEFMHPLFRRGQPHLLADIVKKTAGGHTQGHARGAEEGSSSSGRDVQELRQHVASLTAQMEAVTATMARLSTRVEQQHQQGSSMPDVGSKKRKGRRGASVPVNDDRLAIFGEGGTLPDYIADESDLMGEEVQEESAYTDMLRLSSGDSFLGGFMQTQRSTPDSAATSGSGDLLDILCDLEGTAQQPQQRPRATNVPVAVPVQELQQQPAVSAVSSASFSGPITTGDVTAILRSLDPALQARFVDRLAEVVGQQIVHDKALEKPAEPQAAAPSAAYNVVPAASPVQQQTDDSTIRIPKVPCSCPSCCNGSGSSHGGSSSDGLDVSKAALYGYVLNVLSQAQYGAQGQGQAAGVGGRLL